MAWGACSPREYHLWVSTTVQDWAVGKAQVSCVKKKKDFESCAQIAGRYRNENGASASASR